MVLARKDINSLTESELEDYIHAIGKLRERSAANPDDEAGYDFQAALHNDMFVGPCEHGSDLFLPWHRAHLHYFEKLLQESDPPRTANVTIPYWDWIHPQAHGSFPQAFDREGLFEPGRNAGSPALPPDTLEIVNTEADPGEFGGYPEAHPGGDFGRLERGPHNDMHSRFIVGLMGDPATAAVDPIYFSFHCFIDLMWAEWQRRNNRPPLTSPDANLRGFEPQPKHTVAEFEDTVALGYRYEYSDQLNAAFGVGAPLPPPPPVLALIEDSALEAVSANTVETEIQRNEQVQFKLAAPAMDFQRVLIRLDDVSVPFSGSYRLQVYVHPTDIEFRRDDSDFTSSYGVGYLSMWRAHMQPEGEHGHRGHEPHPHHPTSCTARFDVTRVLTSHPADTEFDVTLQYSPATATDRESSDLIREVALRDIAQEVYR